MFGGFFNFLLTKILLCHGNDNELVLILSNEKNPSHFSVMIFKFLCHSGGVMAFS